MRTPRRHPRTTTATAPATVPTYRGRPLPRPEEDVEDQGAGFDIATLVDRRRALSIFGLGAAGLGLAACGTTTSASSTSTSTASSSTSASTAAAADVTVEIPDETAGPYPGDGSNGPDVLEESGIVRSDITSSFGGASGTAEGVPMTLALTITDLANGGSPFEGVAVYVWHCDREGRYSMYSNGVTDQNYLRGVQVADADGVVRWTSVVPACYSGRWPHVHVEVYPDAASITDASNAIATSQVALPENLCEAVYATDGYEASVANLAKVSLTSDNVFGDDGGASQLAAVTGSVAKGYALSLTVPVDTTTAPTGGGAPGGGAPGGAPGGSSPGS